MGVVIQVMEGGCNTAIHWSPCSKYMAVFICGWEPSLLVLNTTLETLYCSRDVGDLQHLPSGAKICTNWAFNSTLLGFVQRRDDPLSRTVDICWQPPATPSAASTEVMLFDFLMTGLGADETLHCLEFGRDGQLAAISTPVHKVFDHGYEHKLYVLLPDSCVHSRILSFKNACMDFSPAGDRLFVASGSTSELLTSTCSLVQQYMYSRGKFSPCGLWIAVVGGHQHPSKRSVKLCRASDGAAVIDLPGAGVGRYGLSFSDLGDKLFLANGCFMICFGWGVASSAATSRQICSAISHASTWASLRVQERAWELR